MSLHCPLAQRQHSTIPSSIKPFLAVVYLSMKVSWNADAGQGDNVKTFQVHIDCIQDIRLYIHPRNSSALLPNRTGTQRLLCSLDECRAVYLECNRYELEMSLHCPTLNRLFTLWGRKASLAKSEQMIRLGGQLLATLETGSR
jgi:hypothetical protein